MRSGHDGGFQALRRCNSLPILPNLRVFFTPPLPLLTHHHNCAAVKSCPCPLQVSRPQSNLPRPTFPAPELVVHAISSHQPHSTTFTPSQGYSTTESTVSDSTITAHSLRLITHDCLYDSSIFLYPATPRVFRHPYPSEREDTSTAATP